MKRSADFFEFGNTLPVALVASALVAFLGILSFGIMPLTTTPVADMYIEPSLGTVITGENFTIQIVVDAKIPVNVFSGHLAFNSSVLEVEKIDYNTSIADLWAEVPWYSNGDGTLHFAGGSTRAGGFIGSDTLISITFKTLAPGPGSITFTEVRILQHDGLGTDVTIESSIDALFTVENEMQEKTVVAKSGMGIDIQVVEKKPGTDLNGDGKQTVADLSMFMSDLITKNMRSDFNLDEEVNTKDLSIILDAE